MLTLLFKLSDVDLYQSENNSYFEKRNMCLHKFELGLQIHFTVISHQFGHESQMMQNALQSHIHTFTTVCVRFVLS